MDENQPLVLTLFNFKQRIKTIIQDSRLPGYLLEPIFKEIYGDCVICLKHSILYKKAQKFSLEDIHIKLKKLNVRIR